jgi:3-hydroxyacyl-[acyl-carrier-protein] dehydratase
MAMESGCSGLATVMVTINTPFPQILLVECVAQLAGIVAAQEEGEGGFLAALQRVVFGRIPQPGDCLEVSAHITTQFGRLCQVIGQVTCQGEELLSAEMTLGIGSL